MSDKEKDPAFLFYPLDWLQGTASLFPAEKAIYIDLLCHQHQDGSIPNDLDRLAKMVGMPVDQFTTIWSTVRLKFVDRPGNRLVNLRLEKETTKRSTNSHKNAIIGRLAVLVRTTKGVPKEIIEKIKKEFNVTEYEPFTSEDATVRLTAWWTKRLTYHIENGIPPPIENENENKNRIEDDVGGAGGEEGEREGGNDPPVWKEGDWNNFQVEGSRLPAAMMEIVVAAFPDYPVQEFKDYPACWQIAYEIADYKGWKWQSVLNGSMDQMLAEWQQIVTWARGDPWYSAKPVSFWKANFQGLIQAKNNGTGKKNQSSESQLGTSAARVKKASEW